MCTVTRYPYYCEGNHEDIDNRRVEPCAEAPDCTHWDTANPGSRDGGARLVEIYAGASCPHHGCGEANEHEYGDGQCS